jgi:hypothetical protein
MNLRSQAVRFGALTQLGVLVSSAAWATHADPTIEVIEEAIETPSGEEMVFNWRSSPWVRFRLGADTIPDADFGSAEITSTRVAGTVKMLIPTSDQLAFRVVMGSGAAFYDFDGDQRFLDTGRTSGDPFDELIETVFSVGGRYLVNDSWAVLSRTFLTSRHEEDASFGSGVQGGGMVAAGYNWRDRISVIAGVGLGSRLADSGVKVSPVFRAEWQINDRFSLAIDGFEGELECKITEAFQLSAFGGVEGKRYRLENRGGAIGKGTVRDRRQLVGLRGDWRMNSRWRVRTELGSILDQELKVEDSDGKTFDKSHSDGLAFYGSLRFEYRFGN